MIAALGAVVIGIAILAWAADQFVLGAARVALIRKVPSIVVGVVILGFGTSAPELLVSAIAVAGGETDVAIGNIVGSNIANLTLLLGIGAVLVPLSVSSRTVKIEAPLVVFAVGAFALAVQGGGISRVEAGGLAVAMVVSLVLVTRSPTSAASGSGAAPADQLGQDVIELADVATHRIGREIGRTIIGLAGTIGSAQLLLWGALDLAARAELSEGFVGATLVAVGTSLPELVTVIQSARRQETDLIVGNLLGSNLFNALVVGAVVGLIGGSTIVSTALTSTAVIAATVVAAAALFIMWTGHTVSRREGIVLVVAYLCLVPLLA